MEIEDITWVSLTTGWSSEQKGHLAVSNSLLCHILVRCTTKMSWAALCLSMTVTRMES